MRIHAPRMRIAQEKKDWVRGYVMDNMNAAVMDVGKPDFMPRSAAQMNMPPNMSVMRDDRCMCNESNEFHGQLH